jgi:hypothetical protein
MLRIAPSPIRCEVAACPLQSRRNPSLIHPSVFGLLQYLMLVLN